MVTQEYWSAVEEKGLRRNEITCAWFLVLAAVVVLQIVTSLAATPFCPAGSKVPAAQAGPQATAPVRAEEYLMASADQASCRSR